jgi:hypothetical protein
MREVEESVADAVNARGAVVVIPADDVECHRDNVSALTVALAVMVEAGDASSVREE